MDTQVEFQPAHLSADRGRWMSTETLSKHDQGQERRGLCQRTNPLQFVCLFVLRFYGPVNPMGSCRARSVYLTTRLLDRLSPLSG